MEVICLQDEAFYTLVEQVVNRLKEKQAVKSDKWLTGEQVMKLLHVTSKTTLQKLRDEGKVRFSQPKKKIILYDADSVNQYLGKHVKESF